VSAAGAKPTAAAASASAATSSEAASAATSAEILPVATAVSAAVAAWSKTGRRTVLSGVVARREILRRRFIRIRLLLVVGVSFIYAGSTGFGFFYVGMNFGMFEVGVAGFGGEFRGLRFLRAAQRFAGKKFDYGSADVSGGSRGGRFVPVAMIVIVILKIFENVADVQKGITVESDIDESGLHTGKDASDSAFVDAADEGEFFFALDVNLD
jgi:hypothetical protein